MSDTRTTQWAGLVTENEYLCDVHHRGGRGVSERHKDYPVGVACDCQNIYVVYTTGAREGGGGGGGQ